MVDWYAAVCSLIWCPILQLFLINSVLLYRRRSRSISPRRRKSRSPTPRRHKSRTPTPRRHKRQRSRSTSLSPINKSPSIGSLERKNASEKLKIDEEEKKRYILYSYYHTFLSVVFLYVIYILELNFYYAYSSQLFKFQAFLK